MHFAITFGKTTFIAFSGLLFFSGQDALRSNPSECENDPDSVISSNTRFVSEQGRKMEHSSCYRCESKATMAPSESLWGGHVRLIAKGVMKLWVL
jgi:hypothetical protein